ncbi:MAG: hypothetical protein GX799_11425 [Crenarchaeota archaeon]|jgi:hypothetical protein|nr:hypothetical protein [Thermoproteota archaeon]
MLHVSNNTGTTGYVNVNIPKSLLSDASLLVVYLDDVKIEYSLKSESESWILSFSYHHSVHSVDINFDGNASPAEF